MMFKRRAINTGLLAVTIALTAIASFAQDTGKKASDEKSPDASTLVSFTTEDGGTIYADLYGKGKRGVVLVHGGRFNKESWAKQAPELVKAGLRVLAINLRGYGKSTGPGQQDIFSAPLHLDVLAGVRYLHANGAKTVAILGGSLGGGAGGDAVAHARPGEISRLATLAGFWSHKRGENISVPLLVIVTRDDTSGSGPRLPGIQREFDKVPAKKELVVLEGTAHAQFMLDTELAPVIMKKIIKFLSKDK